VCVLLLLHRVLPDLPVLLCANRDEALDRKASPPGVHEGRLRSVCPRDRLAGGTWLGVNARGLIAAITNRAELADDPGRPSRGLLPLLALDYAVAADAAQAVRREVAARPRNGFRLLLADAAQAWLVAGNGARCEISLLPGPVTLWTNEWGPEQADLAPFLAAIDKGGGQLDPLLLSLLQILAGEMFVKPPQEKDGRSYGTVSACVLAVHQDHPEGSLLRYAPGPPDRTPFASYTNLLRRLK
jgi:uncharacterized protein with NRDE domain